MFPEDLLVALRVDGSLERDAVPSLILFPLVAGQESKDLGVNGEVLPDT